MSMSLPGTWGKRTNQSQSRRRGATRSSGPRHSRRTRWLSIDSLESRLLLTANPVAPQFLVGPTLALGDHSAAVAVINSTGDFVTAWRSLEA
ncbi:MAG TPA: hypothetical protein VHC19_07445, partial [Pirellulales bacterium]|nr:hypothetical protein [Pirellulales bacterium]